METANKNIISPDKYKRKPWFCAVKAFLRVVVKKPNFVYLGEKVRPGGIILSNHEGPKCPVFLELYNEVPIRCWGAHEMNKNLKTAYKYQTEIYYHQKKHWNLLLARIGCLIITPVTYLYYKGIKLISSYGDMRFRKTLDESIKTLKDGCSVVIFPEKSENGYLKDLTGFHPGATMLFQFCQKHGLNPPVHVAYLQKETKNFVFDVPTTVNELMDLGLSRTELMQKLCDRCNELGRMSFPKTV